MADTGEVQLHFLDYWRVIKVRFGIIILAFLLVVITAGVTVAFLPRQYFSKVTLEVKPDDSRAVNIFGANGARGMDPTFAPTQFQILQSKTILYPVIQKLKLDEAWGGDSRLPIEQTYIMLLKRMDVRDVRNTDLIEVGVYSQSPEEAAQIANSIATEYQSRRIEDQDQLIGRGLEQLQEEVTKQEKKVEAASIEMTRIRTEQGIVDLSPDSLETVQDPNVQSYIGDEERVNEAQALVSRLESQNDQIQRLKPEELMLALRLLEIEDPTVEQILPQYNEAVATEANLLNSGLGENHPKVKALRAQREVYSRQLSDQMTSIKFNLERRLQIARDGLVALRSTAQESKKGVRETRDQSSTYSEAKNRYIQAKEVLAAARTRLQTETMQQKISFEPAKIWNKAEPAKGPAKPNVPAYMALAVVSGLIVGVGLAFFIEYLDTSVKTVDDVESYLGVSVLGVIRRNVGLLHREAGDTPDAEAYRTIRSNIEFNRKDAEANTITVVSGGPGEGKSTTLANLAFVCAQGGYRVLVIDADLRRPTQHKIWDGPNAIGLTNHLMGEISLEEAIRPTEVENLYLIPSGILPTDAVGILSSQKMNELIARVKGGFDLVFFDSPPILGVSDASVLAKEVDMTLMVVQHRRFPRSMLLRVKQSILNVGGNLLGVVLNNVDTKHDDTYQYYTSYYDYYTVQEDDQNVRQAPAARPQKTASAAVPAGAPRDAREDEY